MNPNKAIPKTLANCKCLCCTDCGYYDKNVSWTKCVQRNKLINEYNYKKGKLGV